MEILFLTQRIRYDMGVKSLSLLFTVCLLVRMEQNLHFLETLETIQLEKRHQVLNIFIFHNNSIRK